MRATNCATPGYSSLIIGSFPPLVKKNSPLAAPFYLSFCPPFTIVRRLLDSQQIYIGGLGSDAVVAKYLFTYIRKMGFNPILLVEEGHTLREYLMNITRQDTLIMCSYPKMFQDEREMARMAKRGGATLVTITDSETSALLLESDYNLSVRQKEKTFFNSYVLPMALCDLLLLKIYEFAPDKVDASLKRYTEVVSQRDISPGGN